MYLVTRTSFANIYYQDENRSNGGLVELTRVSMQIALLDQWSLINVVLSKAPFQVVLCIVEMMVHVSQRLRCLNKFWKIKEKDTLRPSEKGSECNALKSSDHQSSQKLKKESSTSSLR